jgi:hypothetical protein
MAYLPTALLIALVLATGIGWRRRLWALAWGLLWVHVFIAFLMGVMIVVVIWANPELDLFQASQSWQKAVWLLNECFGNRVGTPLIMAVLIWMVVTFRREDWINILGQKETVACNFAKKLTRKV